MASMTTDPTVCDPFWNPVTAQQQEEMATTVVAAIEDATVVPDGDMLTVTITMTVRPDRLQTLYDVSDRLIWDR